ncbi:DUF4232 domain-containing protein [Kitasatospora aureofaciens]|uniref:DUF4232 domain-containing protein n=1 Tax=Kitasatospora aureofaciens TaxID=1894 RepID=UPI001C47B8BD|nr:DUF4232 domain-containing protein [Kitasatospora aureofaciens]MBV6699657.1 DUF4232 domain-containing protein [Kitasatospora aureofaciens]
MRSRIALTAAAIAALTATATACGPDNSDTSSAASSAPTTAKPPVAAAPTATPTPTKPVAASPTKSAAPTPGGKACGANDLTISARLETQAGGYIQISAKAKPGVTCTLPGEHPVIAFGSRGIEAGNAEQAVGQPITLTGGVVAYAGINPKSTNNDQSVEFNDVIVAIGNADPNPVSIPVGHIKVDKAVVTNWHINAKDAVPGV